MKLVFLSRLQNKVQRGAENFVLELSKRLSKNHRVDVFSGKDADDISKVLGKTYDIVIPINGRGQSLKASLGRIPGRYKLLITGHSGIGRDDIWNLVVCKPDVFVALTEQMFRWARNWAWGSKVVKIHNGIDLDKFSPNGERLRLNLPKPIILSVGALAWYKHHEKLIDAVSNMDNGSLLIVGRGEKRRELETIGFELLGERFKIASFDYQEMPKVYRSCDLFSLPSWDREAFGIAYLEAMASGLGVVAPDDAGRREIVGDAGLFTHTDNPSTYAEDLKKALNINWSKKARAQAEKFSWETVTSQYENLMISLLKPK